MNITLARQEPSPNTRQPGASSNTRQATPSGASSNTRQATASGASSSGRVAGRVQSRLTEDTFANFLDGFQEVTPEDLLEARGGRVRYVIESVDAWGGSSGRKYRLGGWLTRVDPALRYLRLVNPYAKRSWSVQLRPPGQKVRLYYMSPGTSDEVATLRNLLTQVETGDIRITRAP